MYRANLILLIKQSTALKLNYLYLKLTILTYLYPYGVDSNVMIEEFQQDLCS